ncbi:MAG: hypothetical protein JNL58_21270 [Planctomyces sp.]|nr:hypothetical protein [Planctomyces sp.]
MRSVRLCAEPLEIRTLLTQFHVTNLNDSGAGSLREAIALANANSVPDEIYFDITGTILLTSGQLSITDSLTIVGPGPDQLTVSGNNQAFRVFLVDNASDSLIDVVINGLTIRDGGNGTAAIDGAGVRSSENLSMNRVVVAGNNAGSQGGGGIQIFGGSIVLQNSTVSDNRANQGGGVELFGSQHTIINSTISGNQANGHGGGLLAILGPTMVRNSTITGNRCDADGVGGGVNGGAAGNAGLLTLHNTIVAGNFQGTGTTPFDAAHLTSASSYNLIAFAGPDVGVTNGINGNIVGVNGVGLREINTILDTSLVNNGGGILTHSLIAGSPAINAGSNAQAQNASGAALTSDQRGFPAPRISGATVDMGAIEMFSTSIVVNLAIDKFDSNLGANDLSLREAIALSNGIAEITTITFAPALSGMTIELSLGELEITSSVILSGPGANSLTLDANHTSRLMRVGGAGPTTVSLVGLTLRGGNGAGGGTSGFGGAIYLSDGLEGNDRLDLQDCVLLDNVAEMGGAIYALDTVLNLVNCQLVDNTATGSGLTRGGGAIASHSTFTTITNSVIADNSAVGVGGAVYNYTDETAVQERSSVLTINDSTVRENSAVEGGAIFAWNRNQGEAATVYLQNSTFESNIAVEGGGAMMTNSIAQVLACLMRDNSATSGGAIYNYSGSVTIINSTLSGNRASVFGGAIWNLLRGSLNILHSTVVLNRADSDGNGYGVGGAVSEFLAPVVARNSIFAGNVRGVAGAETPDDVTRDPATTSPVFLASGTFNNLIGDPNSAGGLVHNLNGNILGNGAGGLRPLNQIVNPLLMANGGPTMTHDLVTGSPALDAGSPIGNVLIAPLSAASATFATDFTPVTNLLNGPGLTVQNLHTTDDGTSRWTTNAPSGSGNDYFTGSVPAPSITFTLDGIRLLTHVSLWGNSDVAVNNDVKLLKLEFSVDRGASYYNSVSLYKPRYSPAEFVHTLPFGSAFAANTVRLTILDNYFGEMGGTGGDRISLDEIRFLQHSLTLSHDQRGPLFARSLDGDHLNGPVVDMGAVESPGIRVTSPSPNAFTLRPRFAWTPIAGATSYEVYISNQSTGVDKYHLATVNGTSYTPSIDLAIGKFRMWIRPKFNGTPGVWSAQHLFNNLTPVTWQSIVRTQQTARPVLSWNSLPGATSYDLWIDNVTTGQQQIVRQQVSGNSFIPATDMAMGLYRCWIRGIDALGNFANWSVLQELLVVPAPTPVGPLNSTFDRTPTFSWNSVAGAASYELYVRNRNTGVMVINGQAVAGTSFTPTTNLTDGKYRWWVVAVRSSGNGAIRSGVLTTDIYVGGQTSIVEPIGNTTDTTPTFTWRAVDGAASYRLTVDRVDVPQIGIINQTILMTTSYTSVTTLAKGTYRAWVRAVSTTGELSVWSTVVNFVIS